MAELTHPWSDGTTHIAFEPLVFLERLAALIPRPRTHLVTYHGVLLPAALAAVPPAVALPVCETGKTELRRRVSLPQTSALHWTFFYHCARFPLDGHSLRPGPPETQRAVAGATAGAYRQAALLAA